MVIGLNVFINQDRRIHLVPLDGVHRFCISLHCCALGSLVPRQQVYGRFPLLKLSHSAQASHPIVPLLSALRSRTSGLLHTLSGAWYHLLTLLSGLGPRCIRSSTWWLHRPDLVGCWLAFCGRFRWAWMGRGDPDHHLRSWTSCSLILVLRVRCLPLTWFLVVLAH